MTGQNNHRIAYFISPHGLGHAARAAAVMDALCDLEPDIAFEIFTLVPEGFFIDSLPGVFQYHPVLTDVGLVQKTPLKADLPATLNRLNQFLPFGHISRKRFRESEVLISYIEDRMKGLSIDEDRFYSGDWISCLPELLAMPRIQRQRPGGATQAARFIHGLLRLE